MKLVGHVLDHALDHALDHIFMRLVITVLQNLSNNQFQKQKTF